MGCVSMAPESLLSDTDKSTPVIILRQTQQENRDQIPFNQDMQVWTRLNTRDSQLKIVRQLKATNA